MQTKNRRKGYHLPVLAQLLTATLVWSAIVSAQSGGSFMMEKSVIGGGGQTTGGTFTLDGTMGQPFGGATSTDGTFEVGSGFWGGGAAVAANVSVSGRILTPDGRGLRNAIVKLTDQQNVTRSVTTSSFGFYTFDNVQTGQTITVRILSKLFRFNQRTVPVNNTDLTGVDFVGVE